MNILYCDVQLGSSGDMLVGALLDAGLPVDLLMNQLSTLPIKGFTINPVKINRYGISGTYAGIKSLEDVHHRNLADITFIIESSRCSELVKNNAISVFKNLAKVESEIHGIPIDKVHFHEIGAIDSIIDIVSFCIGLEYFNIEFMYYSTFTFGTGTIETQHGTIPLPAPATLALTKGKEIIFTEKRGELTTPTAAALLTTLGKQNSHYRGTLQHVGIGFGSHEFDFPSYTRILVLSQHSHLQHELLYVVECTIDDMNPEIHPYITECLFEAGAYDVYYYNVIMKKGRLGTVISILCPQAVLEDVQSIVFSQTTTTGVRIHPVDRYSLPRTMTTVDLYGYPIRIKVSQRYGQLSPKPEYEDCKTVALKTKKPLRTIIEEALHAFYKQNS